MLQPLSYFAPGEMRVHTQSCVAVTDGMMLAHGLGGASTSFNTNLYNMLRHCRWTSGVLCAVATLSCDGL